MSAASVTLPQVLVLNHLMQQKAAMPSALSRSLNVSPPAVSQMLDRLFQLGLVERLDDNRDRRQRLVAATAKAEVLMDGLSRARDEEYERGLQDVSKELRNELAKVLARILSDRTPPALRRTF